jgi:quercetin dioxygenase-like cupin family protein
MLVRKFREVDTAPAYEGIVKRVVIGPKHGAPTFVMRIFDLAVGMSTPYHTHDWEHEVFVLGGQGLAVDQHGETEVSPGDAILVVPNEPHCFKNASKETFRFMCLVPLRGEDSR